MWRQSLGWKSSKTPSLLTLVLGGWGGGLCGLSCIDGLDASLNETTSYHRFEAGRKYMATVVVKDQRVQAWLDGKPLRDVSLQGRSWQLRSEVEACRPLAVASLQTRGRIHSLRLRPWR